MGEWRAIRFFRDGRTIVTKKAVKGSCVVVRDRKGYVSVAEEQLSDSNIYRDVSNKENIVRDLLEANNKMFSSFRKKGFITKKNFNVLHMKINRN